MFESAADEHELESARVAWIGRKGRITLLLRQIPELPAEERPIAGRTLNALKGELGTRLEERLNDLSADVSDAGTDFDITHPGRTPFIGRLHPLTTTLNEIIAVFREMGFDVGEGREVESEYYNFDALTIPEHLPAVRSRSGPWNIRNHRSGSSFPAVVTDPTHPTPPTARSSTRSKGSTLMRA